MWTEPSSSLGRIDVLIVGLLASPQGLRGSFARSVRQLRGWKLKVNRN
jgi:hypothetical protein